MMSVYVAQFTGGLLIDKTPTRYGTAKYNLAQKNHRGFCLFAFAPLHLTVRGFVCWSCAFFAETDNHNHYYTNTTTNNNTNNNNTNCR